MSFQYPKNIEEFDQLVTQDKLVVVEFYATWSGPCKVIAPKLDECSKTYSDAIFAKIDIEEVPDIAHICGVRFMPTVIYFKNGHKVADVIGPNVNAMENTIRDFL